MLLNILLVILVLDCIALVAVILLQQSEGGALGMGGGPTGMFTARGAGDLLTRTTQILAGVFFALALLITLLSGMTQHSSSVVDRLKLDALSPAAPPAPGSNAPPATANSSAPPPLPGTAPAAAPPLPGTAPTPVSTPAAGLRPTAPAAGSPPSGRTAGALPATAPPPAAPARPTRAARAAPLPSTAPPPAIKTQPADPLANVSVAPPPVRAPKPTLNDAPAASQ